MPFTNLIGLGYLIEGKGKEATADCISIVYVGIPGRSVYFCTTSSIAPLYMLPLLHSTTSIDVTRAIRHMSRPAKRAHRSVFPKT